MSVIAIFGDPKPVDADGNGETILEDCITTGNLILKAIHGPLSGANHKNRLPGTDTTG